MASSPIHPEGLLSGLRIVDLTRLLPGPLATQQLADLGADVLKIEERHGDPARHMGQPAGNSLAFQMVNRHKRFATLDLKQEPDRRRLLALAAEADALVESFRPCALDRLGLGWETLHAANPRLVLCSISGYGQDGPYAQYAGHDINYLALAGVLHPIAQSGGVPVVPNLPLSDVLGAQAAATGIVAALLHARVHGVGVHLDVALADAALGANPLALAAANAGREIEPPGQGLLNGGAPCYGLYPCSDGLYLAVGALEAKFWSKLAEGLGLPELAAQHWSQGLKPGSAASHAIRSTVAERFASATRDEWLARLEPLDCCVTPVLRQAEALAHPLFRERSAAGAFPASGGAERLWAAPAQRVAGRAFAPRREAQSIGRDDPPAWPA
ncbi:CaiB/BaiF CoA-transferase family protein [Pusillimonas sp.]|uniref:CaiB/BaiF CoA transferase family protein n=1 Tax=Pusillimonas sp. TaxID=3040095 RepID=UPI0029AC86DA|nr:CaiB/BaiF CoA-transferase family protein [Pusillimonas sp.]MDX3895195.1 CaiB/BaiF CoA-transferase family protein [Pusillimonas sp.]